MTNIWSYERSLKTSSPELNLHPHNLFQSSLEFFRLPNLPCKLSIPRQRFHVYIEAIENVFRGSIAWYKHERGWENSRHLCKPETKSRVCITVENSPNPSRVYIRLCKHRKKVFYCFYRITSSKNCNAGKYFKKFILLIKTYLPTTLIWQ